MAREPLSVEVDVFGTALIRRRLLRFAERAEDMRGAWDDVAAILEAATKRNFATRGASGGIRWRALNERYAAATGRAPTERVLRLSDRLYDSLTKSGHVDHIFEADRDSMRWGSSVPYGKYHQSTRPRRVIPFRPPVRLSENAKRSVTRAIHRELMAGGATKADVALRASASRTNRLLGASLARTG